MKSFLSLWLFAACATAVVKHGTIGYGINMFHPYCCTACSDSLAMVYLKCTTFEEHSEHHGMDMKLRLKKRMDMDMEMAGVTSEDCYASDLAYQQTLAYCVKSHCDAESIPYEKQNECFQLSNHAGSTGPSLQQSLPALAPAMEMAEDAEWLNTTMLVNEVTWTTDRGTIEVFEEMEIQHVAWSIAILVVSVAVPLLTGMYMLLTNQLPLSRRTDGGLTNAVHTYIALPAFGSKRHSEPLAWKIGYLPSRAMTLWITLYILINVFASAFGYRSVQPNSWYASSIPEISAYVGNRAGVLSFANMALAILFAARNNPLLHLSGWDQTTQLTFHRWAARVAVVQAIIHSIAYTADYVSFHDENTYAAEAAKAYFWWGIIATTAMGLTIGFSALPLRAYTYEFFLYSHIVLAIISLLGCWYHIALRFQTKWGYEVWLYLAFAFWAYDRLIRFGKTAYYSLTRRPTAHLEAVEGINAVMMTIALRKPIQAGPGKHTYVYFPSSKRPWENHPFTICDWDDSTDPHVAETSPRDLEHSPSSSASSTHEPTDKKHPTTTTTQLSPSGSRPGSEKHYIRCLFRAHAGMTSQIRTNLHQSMSVGIEGPYGGSTISHLPLHKADTVLCIAGGIGITYISSFARQFARDRLNPSSRKAKNEVMAKCMRFEVAWSVRETALLGHCQRYLLPDLNRVDDGSMGYRFWVTGESTGSKEEGNEGESVQRFNGRMDVLQVVGGVMRPQKRVVVLVCGPGSLADDVRAAVAEYSRRGFVVDLIEESFSW